MSCVRTVRRVARARWSALRRTGSLVRSKPWSVVRSPTSGQTATIGTYDARRAAFRRTLVRASSEIRVPVSDSKRARRSPGTMVASASPSVAPIEETARAYASKLARSTSPFASTSPAAARRLVSVRPTLFSNAWLTASAARPL